MSEGGKCKVNDFADFQISPTFGPSMPTDLVLVSEHALATRVYRVIQNPHSVLAPFTCFVISGN